MAYQIDEVNSDIIFVVNGNKVALKILGHTGGGTGGGSDIYLIKGGESTLPTDANKIGRASCRERV